MAGANLLALIDDIATLLDDVALMTKVAAKKTAGVLGDDLAVNAEQVSGVRADRELPVVWAVFKGSLRNKLIIVPAALLISAVIPWAVTPILMLGGGYLCYEGFEKLVHYCSPKDPQQHEALLAAVKDQQIDMLAFEQTKIAGAVRTDFILSAEIIAITLGTVANTNLQTQVAVLSVVALLMTIGVYGFVAGIVKLDDAGLYLSRKSSPWNQIGLALVRFAPYLMKALTVIGTIAMFIVGGGIITHGLPIIESWLHHLPQSPAISLLTHLTPTLVGLLSGAILVGLKSVYTLLKINRSSKTSL